MTYQVMGESLHGKTHILRKGFATEDDALDHLVNRANWARVWVALTPPAPAPDNSSPPFPWSVRWTAGALTYMVDANGKVFATLLGTQAKREHVASILCALSEAKSARP